MSFITRDSMFPHSPILAVLGAGAFCWVLLTLAGCSGSSAAPGKSQVSSSEKQQALSPASSPSATAESEQTVDPDRHPDQSPLTEGPAELPAENGQARAYFDTLVEPGIAGETWEQAHQGLIGLGEEAIPVLIRELAHQDLLHRETAAMTIALLGTPAPTVIESLKGALQDKSEFVRANVATALVLSAENSADAIPVLLELLKSTDSQLRIMAATNLAAVGEEIAPHADEIAKSLTAETTPEVLLPIVELLGRLGPAAKSSLPELERISFELSGDISTAATQAISAIKQTSEN